MQSYLPLKEAGVCLSQNSVTNFLLVKAVHAGYIPALSLVRINLLTKPLLSVQQYNCSKHNVCTTGIYTLKPEASVKKSVMKLRSMSPKLIR